MSEVRSSYWKIVGWRFGSGLDLGGLLLKVKKKIKIFGWHFTQVLEVNLTDVLCGNIWNYYSSPLSLLLLFPHSYCVIVPLQETISLTCLLLEGNVHFLIRWGQFQLNPVSSLWGRFDLTPLVSPAARRRTAPTLPVTDGYLATSTSWALMRKWSDVCGGRRYLCKRVPVHGCTQTVLPPVRSIPS